MLNSQTKPDDWHVQKVTVTHRQEASDGTIFESVFDMDPKTTMLSWGQHHKQENGKPVREGLPHLSLVGNILSSQAHDTLSPWLEEFRNIPGRFGQDKEGVPSSTD